MTGDAAPRPPVLVAAHTGFAEFQILPCLALLRGHVRVVTAGPTRGPIATECGLRVVADLAWDELPAPSFVAVLIAGALDMRSACESPALLALLRRCAEGGAVIGATSGGALVLHFAGLLAGHDFATSIPREGCAELGLEMTRYRDGPVVADRALVTAKGYATVEFGLAIAQRLGFDVAQRAAYLRGTKP